MRYVDYNTWQFNVDLQYHVFKSVRLAGLKLMTDYLPQWFYLNKFTLTYQPCCNQRSAEIPPLGSIGVASPRPIRQSIKIDEKVTRQRVITYSAVTSLILQKWASLMCDLLRCMHPNKPISKQKGQMTSHLFLRGADTCPNEFIILLCPVLAYVSLDNWNFIVF
jgi:hypothetical protein